MNFLIINEKDGSQTLLNPESIAYVVPINNMDVNGTHIYFASDLSNPILFETDYSELVGLLTK